MRLEFIAIIDILKVKNPFWGIIPPKFPYRGSVLGTSDRALLTPSKRPSNTFSKQPHLHHFTQPSSPATMVLNPSTTAHQPETRNPE